MEQDLKKLTAEWYKKLKDSGFKDVEVGFGPYTSKPLVVKVGHRDGGPWEPKAEYYRLALHFLNEWSFKNRLEETIWAYHTEGLSVRNIVITLNKVRRKQIVRMTVWRTIERLRAEMKNLYKVSAR